MGIKTHHSKQRGHRGIEEAELGTLMTPDVETRGSQLAEVANPALAEHVDQLCGKDAQAE